MFRTFNEKYSLCIIFAYNLKVRMCVFEYEGKCYYQPIAW